MKKSTSMLFIVPMIFSVSTSATFAANYSDTANHWAEAQVSKWSDYGVINGSDGLFRPNDSITRGEIAVIIDKIMGYQTKSENVFNDLSQSFYTDPILRAYHADVINGSDGSVRPNDKITREESAVLICKAFGIQSDTVGNLSFSDKANISSWSLGYVTALANRGYITGRGENNFEPKGNITRSEAVTMIDNIIKDFYNKPGEYSKDIVGTVVVNTPDVNLKNMSITGDLIIAEGVGTGNIVLDSVKVSGRVSVKGGGQNSIHINGSSDIPNVDVSKIDGSVRIAVSDTSSVKTVNVSNGSNDVVVTGKIDTLKMGSSGNTVSAVGAEITNVSLENLSSKFVLDEQSKSNTITVGQYANNSRLDIRGQADRINIIGTQTKLIADKSSNVQNIDISQTASSSNIELGGKSKTVAIASQNTSLTTNENSQVDTITVSETAKSANVNIKGETSNVQIEAPKLELVVSGTVDTVDASQTATGLKAVAQKNGKITTINSKASQTDISGAGKVTNVNIYGNDSNIDTKGTKIKVDSGVKGTTSGNTNVSGGSTTSSTGSSSGSSSGNNNSIYHQNAPTGLWTSPTSSSNNDGRIVGTTTDMEYKLSTSSYYSTCSQGETRGLQSGTYHVRYRERGNYYAGDVTTVIVQYNTSSVSPQFDSSTATFDKNSSRQYDVELKINWGEGIYRATDITSVRVDGALLSSYYDYKISGDYLIIEREALNHLSTGDKYIVVTFNDTLVTSRSVTLRVVDTLTEYSANILSSNFVSNDNITVSENVYGRCNSANIYSDRNVVFTITAGSSSSIDNTKLRFRSENGTAFSNGYANVSNSTAYPNLNVDTTEAISVFYDSKKIGELRIKYRVYLR